MKKYIVVSYCEKSNIVDTVNEQIELGYQPVGGICRYLDQFHQAMILNEPITIPMQPPVVRVEDINSSVERAKTPYCGLSVGDYVSPIKSTKNFTVGQRYEVVEVYSSAFMVIDDAGDRIGVHSHINWKLP